MWTWNLDWNQIYPRLVIGTCPMTPDEPPRIRDETGARAVLSVQHDDSLGQLVD